MTNRIYHVAEDGGLHEGALDHDVQALIEHEVIHFFQKYEVTPAESIASIRRVLKDIEEGR